jgi:nucleotide-binding universal stress UspA family protein
MYRRILVPIDGSPTSKLGLKEAIGLAKTEGARLRVLNVLDEKLAVPGMDAYGVADLTTLLGVLNLEGRKALKDAVALTRRQGVQVDTEMAEGRGRFVSDVIVDAAKTWRADLIVMGTHGRRGFNRLLMGSDAERVLRETPVPVLFVRGEPSPNEPANKRVRKRR